MLGVDAQDLTAVIAKLREMGCRIQESQDRIDLCAPSRLKAFAHLQTSPHPGFPTDMQAQTMALATVAEGSSVIMENVFENRFTHVPEFGRMGADILVSGRMAVVRGVPALHGARVTAHDLRGGAALVLAGLCARGETEVEGVALIDRGYACLEGQLAALGASIARVDVES